MAASGAMANEKRITIRLPAELAAWITEQASELALDDAAWVRMTLQRLKSGKPPSLPALRPDQLPGVYEPEGTRAIDGEVLPPPGESTEDIVNRALQTAGTQGLDRPRQTFMPPEPQDSMMRNVQPVSERLTWDPYNAKAHASRA